MTDIVKKVLTYYQENGRDLPWRHTTNPYEILVSEIMLQQTQVDRVIPYYERFLKKYPDFKALSKAKKPTLLQLWQGLGYNIRILRLQRLAQEVTTNNNAKLPDTEEELLKLPGIGPYTAHAVLAFAHNKPVPVMDTNIRRVLIHELKLKESISDEEIKKIALKIIPKNKSCIWHNALMDYGAMEKTARKTGIESLSKQSKFEGSDRQIRGIIVRKLLKEKSISLTTLQEELKRENLTQILEKMIRDNVIKKKNNIITFGTL
ncbi:MAG: Fe-S cluster assembly protein HesB [Nanoarchaeota archaeon]|nr:Fe-S cluster assembly protein HesB [Nanoarchaeota archaeon]